MSEVEEKSSMVSQDHEHSTDIALELSTPARTEDGPFAKLVEQEWQNLCDKDDRTSPAEYPDLCLVSRLELSWAMAEAWFSAKSSAEQVSGQVPGMNTDPQLSTGEQP